MRRRAKVQAAVDQEKAITSDSLAGGGKAAPARVEKIENPSDYDPARLGDEALRDDFRIALAWWATRARVPESHLNGDTIRAILLKIVAEAKRRGPGVITFHPATMADSVRPVFLDVAREAGVPPEQIAKAWHSLPGHLLPASTTSMLLAAHEEVHKASHSGDGAEDAGNLHALLADELARRGVPHPAPPGDGLDGNSSDLQVEKSERLMRTQHSGVVGGPPISRGDVLPFLETFKLCAPFVHIVGGAATDEKTEGDVDVLVADDSLPQWMRDVIEFRVGRAVPAELSGRLHFLYDRARGPFTSNVEVYDLVLQRVNRANEVKLMRAPEGERERKDWGERPENMMRSLEELRKFMSARRRKSEDGGGEL